jgi:hypothetical protein
MDPRNEKSEPRAAVHNRKLIVLDHLMRGMISGGWMGRPLFGVCPCGRDPDATCVDAAYHQTSDDQLEKRLI